VVEKDITFTINDVALRNFIICHSTINGIGYTEVEGKSNISCKGCGTILAEDDDGYWGRFWQMQGDHSWK